MTRVDNRIDPATYTFPTIHKARLPQLTPALYNAAAKTVIFLIGGAVAFVLYRPLAPPLFVIAGTVVATRLVIKIGEVYDFKPMEKMQIHLAHFRDKHKYIQVAAVIGILIVAVFSWQVACVLAVPFGFYAAVVVGLDFYLAAQEVRRRGEKRGIFPSGKAIFLS